MKAGKEPLHYLSFQQLKGAIIFHHGRLGFNCLIIYIRAGFDLLPKRSVPFTNEL
jgi:hypothetical protein